MGAFCPPQRHLTTISFITRSGCMHGRTRRNIHATMHSYHNIVITASFVHSVQMHLCTEYMSRSVSTNLKNIVHDSGIALCSAHMALCSCRTGPGQNTGSAVRGYPLALPLQPNRHLTWDGPNPRSKRVERGIWGCIPICTTQCIAWCIVWCIWMYHRVTVWGITMNPENIISAISSAWPSVLPDRSEAIETLAESIISLIDDCHSQDRAREYIDAIREIAYSQGYDSSAVDAHDY